MMVGIMMYIPMQQVSDLSWSHIASVQRMFEADNLFFVSVPPNAAIESDKDALPSRPDNACRFCKLIGSDCPDYQYNMPL